MDSIEINRKYKDEKRLQKIKKKQESDKEKVRIASSLKVSKPMAKKQQGEKVPKAKKKKPSR